MDKFRAKKRGFFAISNSLSSSGDKKRNKGDKHEFIYLKGEKSECRNFEGEKIDLNKVGVDSDGETDDEVGQGDTSGQSTSEPETAVSGSSCDDVHKASRKLQSIAKKSIRRDKKKEKEKQERKEKNKLSMDDFLSKQIEFITWLEEEKHKNSKEMSSPKRKAYFKTFLKLWNKRKLPQKYYRGSAEIQSPCPAHPTRTFSFDTEEVVSFTRPKSKRLSIEPWGPPDSPFSTFGKTPPKNLQTSNLSLFESQSSLELGDYQTPKNALPMANAGQSVLRSESSNHGIQQFPAGELPGTPTSSVLEKSPVYAVPWKPKPTPRKKPPVVDKTDISPPPPPVPPKSYQSGEENEVIQQTAQNQQASETKTVSQPGNINDCGQETCSRLGVSETCSVMEVDKDNTVGHRISKENGWHSPIVGKPFSPPVKIRKTFFPQEQIYAEIDSLEMKSAVDKESTRDLEIDDHFSTASADKLHTCSAKLQSDSPTIAPDSEVKPVDFENLQTTRENRFSFSKYLITPEKRAATPKKKMLMSENSKEPVPLKRCLEQQDEFPSLENKNSNQKEKPEIMPRNIPKLRNDFRVTMTIRNGLHNVRNFVIEENKQPRGKDNKDTSSVDPANRQLEKVKQRRKGEQHPAISESRLGMGEKVTLSADGSGNPKSKLQKEFLETDIDSLPLPIMGAKTPPRKRKPLSHLQRSKSLETIIW